MLSYQPGNTIAHRLDPRSKLALQGAVIIAGFSHTTPAGLIVLTGITGLILIGSRRSPIGQLREIWLVLPFLVMAPIIEGIRLNAPWFALEEATQPALASYRILLLILVASVYIQTTAPSESRAAIAAIVPGKPGRYLAISVALVFRFLPVLQADVRRLRDAMAIRLATERSIHERLKIIAIGGLSQALRRSDRLALALRARCFAWNPTPPALTFRRIDFFAALGTFGMLLWALEPALRMV